ncbi:MAG: UvrD-helicase domain-containing protein [Chloroflexi bacterium]|nr:UvrD-helicase domain-containing protein [Chloroflexota bacterium]
MTVPRILQGLNKQQVEAVTAVEGPVLVLAGPGSGKTRVLTHRIAYLIEEVGIAPQHIMALTFTNKAASQMKSRIGALIFPTEFYMMTVGTFHSICAGILRRRADYTPHFSRDYAIYDTADQLDVVQQVLSALNLDPKKHTPRRMLSQISSAKNEMIGPQQLPVTDYQDEIFQRVYTLYNELLQQSNARDFDDLLLHTVQLFADNANLLARYQDIYHYVLVDEFQDTNMVQYTLLKQLAGARRNLFVVGDSDQSIYAFRGADYRNEKRFREDYPNFRLILLEQNYRSHQTILDTAMGVINKSENPYRIQKVLFSERKEGPRPIIWEAHDEEYEARFVVDTIKELQDQGEYDPGDFAVMYRTHAQSRAIEEAFLRAGMPYRLIGATRFYARREIKDALAYLRLIQNSDDSVSLHRIINVPPRGIGQKTLQDLEDWANSLEVSPAQALMLLEQGETGPFNGRARNALTAFAAQLQEWRQKRDELSPGDLLSMVLRDTNYLAYLDDGTPEGDSRVENVMELYGVAASYEGLGLTTFLEEVALISDVDTTEKTDAVPAPSLLTLHSAKGLEFPVVFLVGLEEGILPHSRSIEEKIEDPTSTALEEERRLLYVGLTRAKDRIYLLYTFRRSFYGGSGMNLPSRFLYDIPPSVREGTPLHPRGQQAVESQRYQDKTRWEQAARQPRAGSGRSRPAQRPTDREPKFKAGMVVWHKTFGEGVVMTSIVRGDIEEVGVLFPGGSGEKTIISDFLSPVDG